MKNALVSRLKFRTAFLETVELADSTTSTDLKSLWTTLAESCPFLRSSSKLGKPVPSSFSVKIQRKLASTVPPRPIVEVAQAAAYDHLERLCRDGVAVVEVLNYYDTHSLLVTLPPFYLWLYDYIYTFFRLSSNYSKRENRNHQYISERYSNTMSLET